MTTSTEHVDHIREDIAHLLVENRYDDPGLAYDLLAYVMRELGKLTVDPGLTMAQTVLRAPGNGSPLAYIEAWASEVLQAMQSRAVAGGWPEPPEHPWETVLSDGDGDLG